MWNLFPQPLFAADGSWIVGLLVIIFTVVGWLVNLANSQQKPVAKQGQPQRPRRPQRERVKNEIDIFLKEVRGEAPQEDDIVVESLPPDASRRRSRSTPPPPRQPAPPEAQRGRLGRVASHVESHVGETLATHHLESHIGEREPQATPETKNPRAMGEMMAMQTKGQSTKTAPLPILGMLNNREGIRQAILVNEILSKPKALRDE